MSPDDKYDKKKIINNIPPEETEGGESGESGEGGKSGAIEFHDFTINLENIRDDLLSPEDKRRLISTHKDTHELRVKSQKDKRDQYKALKSGQIPLQTFREGKGAGMNALYKANPVLAAAAQFGGIDKQVNALPTENLAETNQDKREELVNELSHRLGYRAQPKFNPKPQGPGY
jgi:hypothetical protein